MKLNEFYEKILNSIGLHIKDGFVMSSNMDGEEKMVKVSNMPLVMPVKEHYETMTEIKNGEVNITKVLFNPLKEDIKGYSPSLRKLKDSIDVTLSFSMFAVSSILLSLVLDKGSHKKASMKVLSLVGKLSDADKGGTKYLVDEKTIENLESLYKETMSGPRSKGFLHIYLKKGGENENGEIVSRTAKLITNTTDELDNILNKKPTEIKTELRKKDVRVLSTLFNLIIEDDLLEPLHTKAQHSAGTITAMLLYIKVARRLNSLLKDLVKIDEDFANLAMIKIDDITKQMIEESDTKYLREIAVIPNANERIKPPVSNEQGVQGRKSLTDIANRMNSERNRTRSNGLTRESFYNNRNNQQVDNTVSRVNNENTNTGNVSNGRSLSDKLNQRNQQNPNNQYSNNGYHQNNNLSLFQRSQMDRSTMQNNNMGYNNGMNQNMGYNNNMMNQNMGYNNNMMNHNMGYNNGMNQNMGYNNNNMGFNNGMMNQNMNMGMNQGYNNNMGNRPQLVPARLNY